MSEADVSCIPILIWSGAKSEDNRDTEAQTAPKCSRKELTGSADLDTDLVDALKPILQESLVRSRPIIVVWALHGTQAVEDVCNTQLITSK